MAIEGAWGMLPLGVGVDISSLGLCVVDLGGVKDISTIKLFNRGDCCGDRLKGATIEIIDDGLNSVWTETIAEASDKSVAEFVGK